MPRSREGRRPCSGKEFDLSRSASDKSSESKKWLEKNAQAGLNLKAAQTALAAAEKAAAELAFLSGPAK